VSVARLSSFLVALPHSSLTSSRQDRCADSQPSMSIVMAASMLSTLRLYQLVSGSKTSANPFALEWMGAAFEVWGGGTHTESDRRNLWMPQKSGYRKSADNGAKIAHQGREICNKEKRSNIVKRANVRMIQAGNCLRFPLKALLPRRICRHFFGQNPDCHSIGTIQRRRCYSCPSLSFFKAAAASSLRPSFWYARASRKYA